MATRTGWIKRRARRLMAAFRISRPLAVMSAREDWLAFAGARPVEDREMSAKGLRLAMQASTYPSPVKRLRSCDELGVCQLHAAGRRGCDACPYQHIPPAVPPFAPGVIDGPHPRRTGWRAAARSARAWLMRAWP